jgi:ABC-type multidrug transport system permease subunit
VLEKQKQDLLAYFKGARYALNTANSMVLYLKKNLDNFAEYVRGDIQVTCFLYLTLRGHMIAFLLFSKEKIKKE